MLRKIYNWIYKWMLISLMYLTHMPACVYLDLCIRYKKENKLREKINQNIISKWWTYGWWVFPFYTLSHKFSAMSLYYFYNQKKKTTLIKKIYSSCSWNNPPAVIWYHNIKIKSFKPCTFFLKESTLSKMPLIFVWHYGKKKLPSEFHYTAQCFLVSRDITKQRVTITCKIFNRALKSCIFLPRIPTYSDITL